MRKIIIRRKKRRKDLTPIKIDVISTKILSFFFVSSSFFFKFYFIFKLYNIVLGLPNIEMNPPQVIHDISSCSFYT